MQEVQCSRSLPGKQKLQAAINLQTRQASTRYHYLAHALTPAGLRGVRFPSPILLLQSGLPALPPNAWQPWLKHAAMHCRAERNLRQLLQIPGNYRVLFQHGGAHAVMAALPLNLLGEPACSPC